LKRRGQSVLYAVLLMPILILVFALAVDVGSLQMHKLRLRYALDMATVAAATEVDTATYTRSGRLQLDTTAATATAREYLVRNLSGLPDSSNPRGIALAADIAVVNRVPAPDPFTGVRLDRPAVCVRIRVPHRFDLLNWIGLQSVDLTVAADAEIRT
jgi:Flp pilus assembly protein TadG